MSTLEKIKEWFFRPVTVSSTKPYISIQYGTHGMIDIPELGIMMPLYTATNDAQKVVDAANSAAFFHLGQQDVIADHVSSGKFANLIKSRPGRTTAYIRYENLTVESYLCVASQFGHIKKSASGNKLFNWQWEPATDKNPGGLTIYTCLGFAHGDIQDVTLTYWKRTDQINEGGTEV